MTRHFVSATAGGKCSMCELPATHKVGEEIPPDEPCVACGGWWRYPPEDPMGQAGNYDRGYRCDATYHLSDVGPMGQRHNLTAYVCCRHFTAILGPATGCPVPTKTTVMFEGREWILLQRVHVSDDSKTVGYTALLMGSTGAAILPAIVHYIEFPAEELYGNDT